MALLTQKALKTRVRLRRLRVGEWGYSGSGLPARSFFRLVYPEGPLVCDLRDKVAAFSLDEPKIGNPRTLLL